MTYLQFVDFVKEKYKTINLLVIFEIIFKLSKKVKNKIDFTSERNTKIDFKKDIALKYLNQYFLKQKPLGHITKSINFLTTKIQIKKNVFEPRAETEELTWRTINYLKTHKNLVNGVDLCCGSGCIGIAIKKHCPWTQIVGVDINNDVIKNASLNAETNNIQIKFIVGDFYEKILGFKQKFDFIICNPPYVQKKLLKKELLKYENRKCFHDKNPILFYTKLLKNRNKLLRKNGFFAFELDQHIYKRIKTFFISKNDILEIVQSN